MKVSKSCFYVEFKISFLAFFFLEATLTHSLSTYFLLCFQVGYQKYLTSSSYASTGVNSLEEFEEI